MVERGSLRITQVVQHGTCRRRRERPAPQTAAIERKQLKVFENLPSSEIGSENPTLHGCLEARSAGRVLLGMQNLADVQCFESRNQVGRRKFSCAELAR